MEQQKTRRLSLSLKCPLSERFQVVAGEEKERKEVEESLHNTRRWAVRTFEQWRDFYNSKQSRTNLSAHAIF